MPYLASTLLASRMDALIIGRRFIAGTIPPINQGVPLGTALQGQVSSLPILEKPAPTNVGTVVPMGLKRNSLVAISPGNKLPGYYQSPLGALAEINE